MNDDKDKITLDRETFKALAADSRIEILKMLEEHKLTLTDLTQKLDMSPSTIKEHIDRLAAAGLIELIPGDTKWKYYKLTRKGKNVLNPYETKVWFVLAVSLLSLVGVVYNLFGKIMAFNIFAAGKASMASDMEVGMLGAQTPMQNETIALELVAKTKEAVEATTTTIANSLRAMPPDAGYFNLIGIMKGIPLAEVALALFLTLVVGLCVGMLVKKKRIL